MTTIVNSQESIESDSLAYLFDEDGFIIEPTLWTPSLARKIASLDNIGPLTQQHWMIINYLRDRYFRLGAIPPMRRVCRISNLDRNALAQLFGTCRAMFRVAGLPNPGEEVKAYMH